MEMDNEQSGATILRARNKTAVVLQQFRREICRPAWLPDLLRCGEGQSIVEMAFVLPIFVALFTTILQFGIALSNQASLTQAVDTGARYLQTIGGKTTDPCADTFTAIANAAPSLDSTKITLTLTINSTTSFTGNSCSDAASMLTTGATVTVAASYPYSVSVGGYVPQGWKGSYIAQTTEYEY